VFFQAHGDNSLFDNKSFRQRNVLNSLQNIIVKISGVASPKIWREQKNLGGPKCLLILGE